jgi:dsDNA-binding SOS-regulon protein
MTHPIEIPGQSIEELAKTVGNLRYDKVIEFLETLSQDLSRQAQNDYEKGRKQLSFHLANASDDISDATSEMRKAWEICAKHMEC